MGRHVGAQQKVRQEAETVEGNPIRLGENKTEQTIEALNTDLADAYVLYHQLHKHHWQALGGVPHAGMTALSDAATVEPEDVYDIRTS